MAIVMVAGPQIISAIVLATSERWVRNSLLFLAGVTIATLIGTNVGFFGSDFVRRGAEATGNEGLKAALNWAFAALLAFVAVNVYRKRNSSEPPSWMGALQRADGALAFKIGFLLFLLMPTDIITMLTVGGFVNRSGAPYWHVYAFIGATLLLAGAPLMVGLLLGRRAASVLPRVRDWMGSNSWIVSEAVTLFFLATTVKNALGA
jgi:hypothetical protein